MGRTICRVHGAALPPLRGANKDGPPTCGSRMGWSKVVQELSETRKVAYTCNALRHSHLERYTHLADRGVFSDDVNRCRVQSSFNACVERSTGQLGTEIGQLCTIRINSHSVRNLNRIASQHKTHTATEVPQAAVKPPSCGNHLKSLEYMLSELHEQSRIRDQQEVLKHVDQRHLRHLGGKTRASVRRQARLGALPPLRSS
eukprot:Sspe_Gene.77107::Locus_48159_Transcript_1_1_Confidence_1.000_Length_638::g.77107::m.77107